MPFRFPAPALGAALLALSFILPAPALAQQDEYYGLPEAPGREEVAIYCGACHSLMIVMQQGLDRESWDRLLVWMVEEQGMPELGTDERKLILDYLVEHVGPDTHKKRLRDSGIGR